MTFDVTSLLGVLPVTAREITRDETSISWRKVKRRGRDSEEEDELEDENKVASENEYSNPLPDSPPQHLQSVLGLNFASLIDLTQGDQAQVLSQLAGINLRDSNDEGSSSETRLREAEAFIASAVLSQSLTPSPPSPSPPLPPDEPLQEHSEVRSTTTTVRRVGRYENIYTLSNPDDEDDEGGYFEVSRPGIARWSSSPPPLPTLPVNQRKLAEDQHTENYPSTHVSPSSSPSFRGTHLRGLRRMRMGWWRVERDVEARVRARRERGVGGRGGGRVNGLDGLASRRRFVRFDDDDGVRLGKMGWYADDTHTVTSLASSVHPSPSFAPLLLPSPVSRSGCRVLGGGWRVAWSGWRVEGGGWRVEGGGWRVEGGGWRVSRSGCRGAGVEERVSGGGERVLVLLVSDRAGTSASSPCGVDVDTDAHASLRLLQTVVDRERYWVVARRRWLIAHVHRLRCYPSVNVDGGESLSMGQTQRERKWLTVEFVVRRLRLYIKLC
ncbi:hypothetical protein BC629DRAFT_1724070 [Irpex lacteus]|nr:hypothetical protein BC629DRAFT_1724070 [Irpex lacteus]